MGADIKKLTFGRYLKAARLEKDVHIDTISKETRISRDILTHIENEDHDKLPAEVYVKGFLRAYARVIGADDNAAVESYQQSRSDFKDTADTYQELVGGDSRFWKKLLLALVILVCIILLSVFVISVKPEQPERAELSGTGPVEATQVAEIQAPQEKVDDTVSRDGNDEGQPKNVGDEKQPDVVSKELHLKISAVDETWMKVIIDGRHPKEYTLRQGDFLELNASTDFNMLIGNAGGVKLFVNDKPVEISGKRGQVVNVKIP